MLYVFSVFYRQVRYEFSVFFHFFVNAINVSPIPRKRSLLPIFLIAAAIKCWVGEGDIPVVDYQLKECDGIGQNACMKTSILGDKTTRGCTIGVADICLGDTCTCTSTMCNTGMPIKDSTISQIMAILVNVAIAAFVQRMV